MSIKADTYVNLHKSFTDGNGVVYSVRSRETEDYGRVRQHASAVRVTSPRFVVQESGAERARREGQKNVHAFVRGTAETLEDDTVDSLTLAKWQEFSYTPDRGHFFLKETGERLDEGEEVLLLPQGAFVKKA